MLVMLSIMMYKYRKIILNTNISSHTVNVHPGDHRVDISQVDIYLMDKKWCVNGQTKGKKIIFRSLNIIKEILI